MPDAMPEIAPRDVRRPPRATSRARRRARLRPARRLRGPRAQREPVVPDRIRPALRGGIAGRRPGGRPCRARRQRVLRHGGRRASADAAASVPGLQPAWPAARSVSRRSPRSWLRRASARAAGSAWSGGRPMPTRRDERPAGLPRRRDARDGRGNRWSVENATDLLIDAADGLRVINEVEQLAAFEWASCQTSQGVRRLLARAAAGNDGAGGRGAPRLEWVAAVVPPHADRRAACHVRAAQPGRSSDRARRSVHDRLRHLGRAHLPGGLRGRVGGRAARTDP